MAAIANFATKSMASLTRFSKVGLEVGSQIWKRESLAPPDFGQFSSAFAELGRGIMHISTTPIQNYTVMQLARGGLLAVEVVGVYTIGKIIGRRQIVGYEH